MRASIFLTAAFLTVSANPAFAVTTNVSSPATKAVATPAQNDAAKLVHSMRKSADKMRERIADIQKTEDPKRRLQLLREHTKLMMAHMDLLTSLRTGANAPTNPTRANNDEALDPTSNEMLWHGLQMVAMQLHIMEDTLNQLLQQQEMMMQMLRTE